MFSENIVKEVNNYNGEMKMLVWCDKNNWVGHLTEACLKLFLIALSLNAGF